MKQRRVATAALAWALAASAVSVSAQAPIDVGPSGRTETKAEIIEGLAGGESVVTKGAYGVEDSAKVTKPAPAAQ